MVTATVVTTVFAALLLAVVMAHWRRLAPTLRPGMALPMAGSRPGPARPGLVGREAARIAGTDPEGDPAGWTPGRRDLVAFLTGECTTCRPFWAGLIDPVTLGTTLAGLPVVVVTPSPGTESRRGLAARRRGELRVIMSTEAWLDYGVRGAPWFVVVADGIVAAEGTAGSWAELRALTGT